MNTKKFAVSLGGLLAVTAPIVAVISCGNPTRDENPNAKLAKQLNDKIKQNIVETKKNSLDILKAQDVKNGEIKPDGLGIQNEIDAIGGVPKDANVKHVFFLDKSTTENVTVISKIFYDQGTANENVDSMTFTLKTLKMDDAQRAEYNEVKYVPLKMQTENASIEVAKLPEAGKTVTVKDLGIKEFAFEGVAKSEITIKSKDASTDAATSGTVVINVKFTVGDSNRNKEVTIFGFKESKLVENTKTVKNAIADLQKVNNLQHPAFKDSLQNGDKLELKDIQNLPESIKKLPSEAVKFEFIRSWGEERVEATITVGEGEFQQYTEKVREVAIKFATEKQALETLTKEIQKIEVSTLTLDAIKTVKEDKENYISKEDLVKALGIKFDETNKISGVKFAIAKKEIKDSKVTITLNLKLRKESAPVTFTLSKFGDTTESNEKQTLTKIINHLEKTPFETSLTKDAIKGIEEAKGKTAKELSDILKIKFDDKEFIVGSVKPKYDFLSFDAESSKASVVVTIGDSVSQKVAVKLTFKDETETPTVDGLVKKVEAEISKQAISTNTFAILKNAFSIGDNSGVTLEKLTGDLGINLPKFEIPGEHNLSFAVKNKSVSEELSTVTFTITIKIDNEAYGKPFDLHLMSSENKPLQQFLEKFTKELSTKNETFVEQTVLRNKFKEPVHGINIAKLGEDLGLEFKNKNVPEGTNLSFDVKLLNKNDDSNPTKFNISIKIGNSVVNTVEITLITMILPIIQSPIVG